MYESSIPAVLGSGVAVGALAMTGLDLLGWSIAAMAAVISGMLLIRTQYLRRRQTTDA